MGREVVRVPADWEHPKKKYADHRRGVVVENFKPLYMRRSCEEAWAEWQKEYAGWLGGEFDRIRAEYGAEYGYDKAAPYAAFCDWHGRPPDPDDYRPHWPEGSATWWQVYETVSEGTPVTPKFATAAELVDYLATHGDFWDQKRATEGRAGGALDRAGPWDRKAAEAFVGAGSAPSLVVQTGPGGTTITEPRDGPPPPVNDTTA